MNEKKRINMKMLIMRNYKRNEDTDECGRMEIWKERKGNVKILMKHVRQTTI